MTNLLTDKSKSLGRLYYRTDYSCFDAQLMSRFLSFNVRFQCSLNWAVIVESFMKVRRTLSTSTPNNYNYKTYYHFKKESVLFILVNPLQKKASNHRRGKHNPPDRKISIHQKRKHHSIREININPLERKTSIQQIEKYQSS